MSDWAAAPLPDLLRHILERHHTYTREALDRISREAGAAARTHGAAHPELSVVSRTFGAMAEELRMHMMKEERILFPYIMELGRRRPGDAAPFAPFGSIENPVRMMLHEHDETIEQLRTLREASHGFKAAAGADPSIAALYAGMEALEKDLLEHIHLESDFLFPRAVELESGAA